MGITFHSREVPEEKACDKSQERERERGEKQTNKQTNVTEYVSLQTINS
jgi:hypothetical protein